MRARHLSSNHPAARLGGVLAIALGVGLLALAVTSGEVDDGGSSDLAAPTARNTEATVLGEVIEGTTLPDAPPASAVGFTTTSAGIEDGDPGPVPTSPPPSIGSPTSTTPPPTIGPPTSIVRPTTTTTSTTAPSAPECSDGIDNDDTEDSAADAGDPGCHSDGNAANPDSYVAGDNDEGDPAPVSG